jgi:hypothetical protein
LLLAGTSCTISPCAASTSIVLKHVSVAREDVRVL